MKEAEAREEQATLAQVAAAKAADDSTPADFAPPDLSYSDQVATARSASSDTASDSAIASGSAPASAPAQSDLAFPVHTRVVLHGLQARPELNGSYGLVLGRDTASGRYKVLLEASGQGIKLKVENISACDEEPLSSEAADSGIA